MKRGDIHWLISLALTLVLLFFLNGWLKGHIYLLGFIKFSTLASLGELLAGRLGFNVWRLPKRFATRFLIWGLVGVLIAFFFQLVPIGVNGMMQKGLLPGKGPYFKAIYSSVSMNLSFGIAFMAAHRVSDSWLDLPKESRSIEKAVSMVDWSAFVKHVVLGSLIFFWIPAHTLTFLLPESLRVTAAALLSIALGLLLSFKRKHAQ